MSLEFWDSVEGILALLPQYYDSWERAQIRRHLPSGGTFVDLGANVGAYSLWAASCVGPAGKVLAVEAEPENYGRLLNNIGLNPAAAGVILTTNTAVSDEDGEAIVQLNTTGNRGAHSLLGTGNVGVATRCLPLFDLLQQQGVDQVDFMKIDIEGMETRVFKKFFEDTPALSRLRPEWLLIEINGSPTTALQKQALRKSILCNGYEAVFERQNTLFRKRHHCG